MYLAEIQNHLWEAYDLDVCATTISESLQCHGYTQKKVTHAACERNEECWNQYQALIAEYPPETHVYLDESACNCHTSNWDYAWAPIGDCLVTWLLCLWCKVTAVDIGLLANFKWCSVKILYSPSYLPWWCSPPWYHHVLMDCRTVSTVYWHPPGSDESLSTMEFCLDYGQCKYSPLWWAARNGWRMVCSFIQSTLFLFLRVWCTVDNNLSTYHHTHLILIPLGKVSCQWKHGSDTTGGKFCLRWLGMNLSTCSSSLGCCFWNNDTWINCRVVSWLRTSFLAVFVICRLLQLECEDTAIYLHVNLALWSGWPTGVMASV